MSMPIQITNHSQAGGKQLGTGTSHGTAEHVDRIGNVQASVGGSVKKGPELTANIYGGDQDREARFGRVRLAHPIGCSPSEG